VVFFLVTSPPISLHGVKELVRLTSFYIEIKVACDIYEILCSHSKDMFIIFMIKQGSCFKYLKIFI
jgi:hypothetical protein